MTTREEVKERGELLVSPSQVADHHVCPRKRWFQKVHHLHAPETRSKTFGTVVHAVLARYLEAGRTEKADLYPDGWSVGLTVADQALVQRLVAKVIEAGIVTRRPGARIEHSYVSEVIPGAWMHGVMDVWARGRVEDHKTTSARRWALSQDSLADDVKMLCYAHEAMQELEEGEDLELRLNYLETKVEQVWPVDVVVSRSHVERAWQDKVVPAVREMVALKDVPLSDWRKVEGPREKRACEKFGGCPYARVCGGVLQPERLQGGPSDFATKVRTKGDRKLKSLFDKKRPGASEPERHDQKEVDPPKTATGSLPPWAVADCKGCGGTGFNSRGAPCKACNAIRHRNKEHHLAQEAYDITTVDGVVTWKDKASGAAGQTAEREVETPKPKPVKRVEPPKEVMPEPKAERVPTTVTKPESFDESSQTVANLHEEVERIRQQEVDEPEARALTLLINAVPVGGVDYLDLSSVLRSEGQGLVQDLVAGGKVSESVTSYYELEAFKRRDMLRARIGEVAEQLRGSTVVALGRDPDLLAYAEALKAFAGTVIVGVGQ